MIFENIATVTLFRLSILFFARGEIPIGKTSGMWRDVARVNGEHQIELKKIQRRVHIYRASVVGTCIVLRGLCSENGLFVFLCSEDRCYVL